MGTITHEGLCRTEGVAQTEKMGRYEGQRREGM